jgi:penicillin amidase
MNLPDDYPIDEYRIGFEWSAPWRYSRLWEVLAEDDRHSLDVSLALQRDYHSVLARKVLSLLPDIAQQPDGEILAKWDTNLTADSPAAALWNVWYSRHLTPTLGSPVMQTEVPSPQLDSLAVLELLATAEGKKLAYSSLANASAETRNLLGEVTDLWRWGDLHRIRFEHPLYQQAPPQLQAKMLMPHYPRGGSGNTTNNTGYRSNSFDVVAGASFRMVLDVGNWDAALATNAPGQSGNPHSPFYQNLLENWATDGQFPLVYSRSEVVKHKAFTITLQPTVETIIEAKAETMKGQK